MDLSENVDVEDLLPRRDRFGRRVRDDAARAGRPLDASVVEQKRHLVRTAELRHRLSRSDAVVRLDHVALQRKQLVWRSHGSQRLLRRVKLPR